MALVSAEQDRIKYLATPRTDLYKKCAQLKAEMDNEEFLNECSFKVLDKFWGDLNLSVQHCGLVLHLV